MARIDNSYLLGLFSSSSGSGNLFSALGSSAGANASDASALATQAALSVKKTPSAPWRSTELEDSELIKAALMGRAFINENGSKLDVKGASDDYRKLFALYQGLNTLEALATRATAKRVGEAELDQLRRVFAKGLGQVNDYADSLKLENIRLTRGSAMTRDQAQVGVKRTDTVYQTAPIASGSADNLVASFAGDVRFSMAVKKVGGTETIDFDLGEMGATPRTLVNVVDYLNGKLADAGVKTRFGTQRISGKSEPITVGGKTVTLPDKADQWALTLKGDIGETLTLSAPATAEAVYVAQMAGKPETKKVGTNGTTSTTEATLNAQLLKFQSDVSSTVDAPPATVAKPGEANYVDGRAFSAKLGSEVENIRASVTGPDGSVYVIADVNGTTANQTIKGDRDVALMKYDSAGNLVYTRTLGAGQTASGYALAVSADGKIAIAGSVTGVLDPGSSGVDKNTADTFVTLFDEAGDEVWTQRRAARGADEASALAFGDDGSVYVAGRAKSAMPGSAGAIGGWDGYLMGFDADGDPKFATQFGTTSDDKVSGLAVSGSTVVVAGVEQGDAVLRRFDLQPSGAPVLAATRGLGPIQGSLAGVVIDGGDVYVAGTTANSSLAVGAGPTQAHSGGGTDAFAARLSLDLQAAATDRLAYYGGAGADGASAVAVSNGKVWIAGSSTGELPAAGAVVGLGQTAKDGFLARLDLETGDTEWARRFTSTDGQVAPTSIAVASAGASALDRFGLPSGTIAFKDSKLITSATSVRAGDQFYIRTREGMAARAITIEADDTLASLAKKISRASGFSVKVEVQKKGDYDYLKISPLNDRSSIEVVAGKTGKNALVAMGLTEGVVSNSALSTEPDVRRVYGLGLTDTFNLDTPEDATKALKFVQIAISTIKNAYNFISNPELFAGNGSSKSKTASGPPPAYLTNQISNYQAALARLTGGG